MSDQYPPQNPYAQQPEPTGPGGEPPLWAPYYGISFGKAFSRFFKKYATFSGRASRSEFWWWYLANVIIGVVLGVLAAIGAATSDIRVDSVTGQTTGGFSALYWIVVVISIVWGLAIVVPSLALGWRRLHDANLSGALWIIAIFVNIVGLVFGLLPSNPQGARFDRPEGAR
ncbi:DUF805 domain-containing protein [Curtobacterium flaccumfaciens]|nr:DUF805 domain-containing protein [Curtobacterium flaccumfaciens]